jgi:hypothetical protein
MRLALRTGAKGPDMDIAVGIIGVAVIGYLLASVLRPEWF